MVNKEIVALADPKEILKKPGLPTYLPSADLTNMLEGPIDLDKICKYLNEIHNPHGTYYAVTKAQNGLKVTGRNLTDFFVRDADNKFLIATESTVNKTCIDHTEKILTTLEKKNIGILTALRRGWQKFYFQTKTGLFLSYGFFGSLNVLQTAGSASLMAANGAATMSLPGVMAISFVGGLFLNLVSVYIPNGPVKDGVKFSAKLVSGPTAIGLWTYNQVLGIAVETPMNIIASKFGAGANETIDYTIKMARDLGFYESPVNMTFNETVHQLKYWGEKGYIMWKGAH